MPILRELISRFSFETDKKSVSEYNKQISGMQRSAIKLGSILGVSLGGKALFGMGVSALQAEENLKRLTTDIEFDTLNTHLSVMKERLDNIQEGSSNILREKTINVLASSFIKDFGAANKEIETFTSLLESAALQATITGVSVEEIFTSLVDAIKTGDFSGIVGIGGIDLRQQKIVEAVTAAKDPQELGGQIGRDIRTQAVLEMLGENITEQRRQAANISRELVSLKIATQSVKDSTDSVSETAAAAGIQAAEAAFNAAKQTTEAVSKDERPVSEAIKGGLLDLFNLGVERIKQRREARNNNVEVNMPTTINVYEATDIEGIKRIVESEDDRRIDEARRQMIRTEDIR